MKDHISSVVLTLLCVIGSSCTATVMSTPIDLIDFPTADGFDVPITLELSSEFGSEALTWRAESKLYTTKIREALVGHSVHVAEALFTDVSVSRGQVPPSSTDLTLTPTLLSVTKMRGPFQTSPYENHKVTFAIQWTLTNNKGERVWEKRIAGSDTGLVGGPFTRISWWRDRVQGAVEQAFQNGFDEIGAAGAIRKYVEDERQ